MYLKHHVSTRTVTLLDQLDLGIFGAREIRNMLKCRSHCLQAGFSPNHVLITTFNEIRDAYLLRVGLATYLSQMLGDIATSPISACQLYNLAETRLEVNFVRRPDQPLQRFIADNFLWDEIPARVEVTKVDKREVRYL
jgi:hypothetical protein